MRIDFNEVPRTGQVNAVFFPRVFALSMQRILERDKPEGVFLFCKRSDIEANLPEGVAMPETVPVYPEKSDDYRPTHPHKKHFAMLISDRDPVGMANYVARIEHGHDETYQPVDPACEAEYQRRLAEGLLPEVLSDPSDT